MKNENEKKISLLFSVGTFCTKFYMLVFWQRSKPCKRGCDASRDYPDKTVFCKTICEINDIILKFTQKERKKLKNITSNCIRTLKEQLYKKTEMLRSSLDGKRHDGEDTSDDSNAHIIKGEIFKMKWQDK